MLASASSGLGEKGISGLNDLDLARCFLDIIKMEKKERWKMLTIGTW